MGSGGGDSISRPARRCTVARAVGRDHHRRPDDRLQLVQLGRMMWRAVYDAFAWCQATQLGEAIRASLWLFPVIETFHLLALSVMGGMLLVVDLRLLGLGLRRHPVGRLAREVQPWLIG